MAVSLFIYLRPTRFWRFWLGGIWITFALELSARLLFLVGYSLGEQSFGPFWSEEFIAKMDHIPSQMSRKLYFARKLQEVLSKCDSDRSWRWIKSYREAMQYFSIHRGIVMAVGELLDINMNDHDLTKTRLFRLHWVSSGTGLGIGQRTNHSWPI